MAPGTSYSDLRSKQGFSLALHPNKGPFSSYPSDAEFLKRKEEEQAKKRAEREQRKRRKEMMENAQGEYEPSKLTDYQNINNSSQIPVKQRGYAETNTSQNFSSGITGEYQPTTAPSFRRTPHKTTRSYPVSSSPYSASQPIHPAQLLYPELFPAPAETSEIEEEEREGEREGEKEREFLNDGAMHTQPRERTRRTPQRQMRGRDYASLALTGWAGDAQNAAEDEDNPVRRYLASVDEQLRQQNTRVRHTASPLSGRYPIEDAASVHSEHRPSSNSHPSVNTAEETQIQSSSSFSSSSSSSSPSAQPHTHPHPTLSSRMEELARPKNDVPRTRGAVSASAGVQASAGSENSTAAGFRAFAVEEQRPPWVSNYPPAPMDCELGTGKKHPFLAKDPFPIDSAVQHKYDVAEKQLLAKAGLIEDAPEFKLAFRTLRPSDRFQSLGQHVPYL